MTRIGWIGVGRMGAALVARLIAAGHAVTVYNRTRAKAEAVSGATVAGAIADLAGFDVVFTSLPDSPRFAEVAGALLDAGGCRVLVDTSTAAPDASQRVRERAAAAGTALLAAPVSGNPGAVAAGDATLVVSGPREAFDEVCGLLGALGRAVTYVGEGESARVAKLCHNIVLGVLTQALAEVTVMAEKAGIPRSAFLGFRNDSVLGSTFTRYKTPALVGLGFTPSFTTELLRKDFDLGLAAARALAAPVPLAALTHRLIQAAVATGHGEEDFAALLVEQARAAGLDRKPEGRAVRPGRVRGRGARAAGSGGGLERRTPPRRGRRVPGRPGRAGRAPGICRPPVRGMRSRGPVSTAGCDRGRVTTGPRAPSAVSPQAVVVAEGVASGDGGEE